MRPAVLLLLLTATAAIAQAPSPAPGPRAGVSMEELMIKVVYPYSDAVFYVKQEAPKNEAEWAALESKTLALAEVGNLLMSPVRAYDQDQWMRDAQLLVNAAMKAYKGAKARDLRSILALNAEMYAACQTCHADYHPGHRQRP